MAPLNRRGTCAIFPAALRRRTIGPSEAADGTVVVDLRPRRDFALSHLAGSLNIEWVDSFAAYVGWTVPWGTPVTLLAEEWRQLERAAEALARIGIDEVSGALHNPSGMVAAYRVADFSDLVTATQRGESPLVVDARDRAEWEVGHLPMAELIPFYCVEAGVSLLPSDVDVWVHCARGYRAAIAASILERHGRRPILIDDSYEHAVALGLAGQIHQVGA
jgi:rhodanese-related sulfurtransferase